MLPPLNWSSTCWSYSQLLSTSYFYYFLLHVLHTPWAYTYTPILTGIVEHFIHFTGPHCKYYMSNTFSINWRNHKMENCFGVFNIAWFLADSIYVLLLQVGSLLDKINQSAQAAMTTVMMSNTHPDQETSLLEQPHGPLHELAEDQTPFPLTISSKKKTSNPKLPASKRKLRACPICHETFTSYYGYIIHKNTHDGIYPYKCELCGGGYTSKAEFDEHIMANHSQCHLCPKVFTSALESLNHMKWIHHLY